VRPPVRQASNDRGLYDAWLPPGADLAAATRLAPTRGVPEQIVVAWRRDDDAQPLDTVGLTIWQGSGRDWEPVYSRVSTHVYWIDFSVAELTGDAHPDLLVREDIGGSGSCGIYRVLSSLDGRIRQLFVRTQCRSAGSIAAYDGALHIRDSYGLLGALAAARYRLSRTTVRRWNGKELAIVSQSLRRNRGR
jgi:hypothetical protein